MGYRRLIVPLGLSLTLLLASCGVTRKVTHPVKTVQSTVGRPPTLGLLVDVQPNANNNSPVAFDVVLAKDKALVKQLASMTAANWFAKRAQIERDSQSKVEVHSWEWVPAQNVGKVPVAVNVDVLGVVAFANYATPGDHRAILSLGGTDTVTFNESDFSVAREK